MGKLIKLSFTGDIMCGWTFLKAAKKRNYDFMDTFEPLKKYLSKSDYVIGNLETPIAKWYKLGFTHDWSWFNTPKSFLKAVKDANFNLLMTSNNHCLDRGISGLKDTIKNIKKYNMEWVGTNLKNESNKYKIIEIDGIKIAFLGYTYGTNYSFNRYRLKDNQKYMVNLIKKQNSDETWPIYSRIKFYKSFIRLKLLNFKKKITHYKSDTSKDYSVIDNLNEGEWKIDNDLLNECKNQIASSKNESDISIFMLHSGGQLNQEPGTFTQKIMKELEDTKVDVVIGTHPHVVQKSYKKNNRLFTYSLGDLDTSPSSFVFKKKDMGDYSVILNVFIDKTKKQIVKYSFMITKVIENNGYLTIYPLYDLIKKETDKDKKEKLIQDNLKIYNKFLNTNLKDIKMQLEYKI